MRWFVFSLFLFPNFLLADDANVQNWKQFIDTETICFTAFHLVETAHPDDKLALQNKNDEYIFALENQPLISTSWLSYMQAWFLRTLSEFDELTDDQSTDMQWYFIEQLSELGKTLVDKNLSESYGSQRLKIATWHDTLKTCLEKHDIFNSDLQLPSSD